MEKNDHAHITPRVSHQSELLIEGKIGAKEYFDKVAPEPDLPAFDELRRSSQHVKLAAALLGLFSVLIFVFGAVGLLNDGRRDDAAFSLLGGLLLAVSFGQLFGQAFLALVKRSRQ